MFFCVIEYCFKAFRPNAAKNRCGDRLISLVWDFRKYYQFASLCLYIAFKWSGDRLVVLI